MTQEKPGQSVTRVTRDHAEARVSYDRLSRWYDLIAAPSERRFRQVGLHMLAARPGETVLEIGSGTGGNLISLGKDVGEQGLVVGLDLSPRMLTVSRQKLERAELLGQTALVRADGACLPFAPASFDALFMAFVLELFDTPEIPRVLAGCSHALRPGGRLVVVSLLKQNAPVVRLYEWIHERFQSLLDCRPILPRQMIAAAGFEIISTRRESMWGLPVEIVMGRRCTKRL